MRRLNFRRDDGVAMTEFALILPIFMWFLLRPAGDAKEPPRKAITTDQLQKLINSQTKR